MTRQCAKCTVNFVLKRRKSKYEREKHSELFKEQEKKFKKNLFKSINRYKDCRKNYPICNDHRVTRKAVYRLL